MKLLVLSQSGIPTGYGRIADQLLTRLHKRGVHIHACSLGYDGLLPPQMDNEALPYWVAPVAAPSYPDQVLRVASAVEPDVLLVIEDAPYLEAIRAAPYDWSTCKFVGITPVDGTPIYPRWLQIAKQADAWFSISQFGVDAYRRAGVATELARPGVNQTIFFRKADGEREALRAKLDLKPGQFLLGTMAQNQGRKAISIMVEAFFRFCTDKPDARYLLDMEPVSPAGWDVLALCEQYGWDASKLIFRSAAVSAGLTSLTDRYNLLDAHMVIAHREGYGLPLVEAMACGAPGVALDYCSGPEIVGANDEARGVLVKALDYTEPGTWGGAEDKFPDKDSLNAALNRLYCEPVWRAQLAQKALAWAQTQTWDAPAQALYDTLVRLVP